MLPWKSIKCRYTYYIHGWYGREIKQTDHKTRRVFSWHAAKPYQEAICKIQKKNILKIGERSKHLWENNADKTLRGELRHAGHRNLCPLWLLSGSAACPPRTSLVKSSTLNSGKLQFTPKPPPLQPTAHLLITQHFLVIDSNNFHPFVDG